MSSAGRNQQVANFGRISHDQPSRGTTARTARKKRTEAMLDDQVRMATLILIFFHYSF